MKDNIWLTGDVHHMTMRGNDQKLLKQKNINTTEVELCEPYLDIANGYGFTPTLFFTGKAVAEEGDFINYLFSKYNFNVGGHTYSAYSPKILSRLFSKLKNSPYLFIHNQKKDIIKTKNIIKKKLGINIIHWRNHGYRSDKFTNEILESLNFRYVSNEVNEKKYFEEFILNDLKSRPINTLPDHENLPHSKEHKGGLSPEKWVILNSKKVKEMKKKNGIASLLLHPLCMYLEDDFQYMKKLLSILV